MSAPSDLPVWASSGSAEIDVPPTAIQEQGWTEGYPPPHEWVNWMWNRLTAWIRAGGVYDSLEAAYAALQDGERAMAWDATATAPLTSQTTLTVSSNFRPQSIVSDGAYIYVGGLDVAGVPDKFRVYRIARNLGSGTPGLTFTPTNESASNPLSALACDGEILVIGNDDEVTCFNVSTGAILWAFDHNATVNAVAIMGDVYIAGEAEAVTDVAFRRLARADGAEVWSFTNDGAAGDSIAVALPRAFLGMTSSAPGEHPLRAVNADTGQDAVDYGGNGVDASGASWEYGTSGTISHLVTDGLRVYSLSGSDTIIRHGIVDGVSEATYTAAATIDDIAVDDQYLYIVFELSSQAYIEALDKTTLDRVGRTILALNTDGNPFARRLFTDGGSLFAVLRPDGGMTANHVRRLTPAVSEPKLYERTDHTAAAGRLPWRRALHPMKVR